MDGKIIFTFISLCILCLVHGDCPESSELDRVQGTACARTYESFDCKGPYKNIYDGWEFDYISTGRYDRLREDRIRSVVVKKGCWMKAWRSVGYEDNYICMTGKYAHLDDYFFFMHNTWGEVRVKTWADVIKSLKCHCG